MNTETPLSSDQLKCDAATGLEAGLRIAALSYAGDINGMPVRIVPDGFKVEQFPELLPKPLRKTGRMVLNDLASFARFFSQHKTPNSIIVADVDPKGTRGTKFVAVFNYHGSETAGQDFGDFRAEYTAQLSVEWQRWMAQNGKPLAHAAFLQHLEDNQAMIIEPKGADLMELISSLEGRVDARFTNALNLHNGRMKLSYEEDVELRGTPGATKQDSLEVPSELLVGVAPFEFGDAYRVRNRLRYRVQSRQLAFAYEVVDPHKIIQDAATGQMAKVEELTGVKPLCGQAA